MELREIHAFCTVAREQSFSKAAGILHISQPALSILVKRLEGELQTQLLERIGRKIIPTTAGEYLLNQGIQLWQQFQQLQENVSPRRFLEEPKLIIGAGTTTIINILPPVLKILKQNHPALELIVRGGSSQETIRRILRNSIDLGLITTPADLESIVSRPVFAEKIIPVSAASHPAARKSLNWLQLLQQPMILFPRDSGFRQYLDGIFQRHAIPPRVTMELDDIEAIKKLVEAGLGLSFLPEKSVADEINAGRISRVVVEDAPVMERKTFLAFHRKKYFSPGLVKIKQEFVELLMRNI
ncbi:MAG: LysR family transcriptional regulator [Bacillota bacterium]